DDDATDESAAAFGLQLESPCDTEACNEVFFLWPCNVPVWNLWWRVQTLWRAGAQGREGLDYGGLVAYLREGERIHP
ncbi:DUF1799 domain-containing protein, partial [bacterium]|nr:DUF1799 domain-containing protein [bacterium]